MNIEKIKVLSYKETQLGVSLLQRAGKLSEEQGELWQEILAYTGCINRSKSAAGTREAVVEETVDVMINCLDILFAMGVCEEELQEVLDRKTNKWEAKLPATKTLHLSGGKL